MLDYNVPFYANTSDDTHCMQAAFKMVAEFFRPELILPFDEWDVISRKKKDGWTWPMAGLLWFIHNGFDVIDIEMFDYEKFIEHGKGYLQALFGEEVANKQEEMSDLQQERAISRDFIREVHVEQRKPSIEDIRNLLTNGYLVLMSVNSRTLNGKDGYAGHVVVAKGLDDRSLILHDPGLPPAENRGVEHEAFLRAWAYPNDNALNLVAVRDKS